MKMVLGVSSTPENYTTCSNRICTAPAGTASSSSDFSSR
jgi:hypothetical protein